MGHGQYDSLGEYYAPDTASSVFLILLPCKPAVHLSLTYLRSLGRHIQIWFDLWTKLILSSIRSESSYLSLSFFQTRTRYSYGPTPFIVIYCHTDVCETIDH